MMSRTDACLPSRYNRRSPSLRPRGFSLVELLVCICVLGSVTSLAAPYLGTMLQNYRLQATARQLVTDLQLAKMKAVAQKVQYLVAFDTTNNRYSISMGNSSFGSTTWTQMGISRSLSDPTSPYYSQGVTLADNFAAGTVIFSPTGQASGTGAATLTASGYLKTVAVTLAGGIYVQ